MIPIINQSILEANTKYIAHQCNCITSHSAGIAKRIFDKYPYAIDIWSLGVMILEILISCPVWMSYKARTIIKGKVIFFYSRLFLQQDYLE